MLPRRLTWLIFRADVLSDFIVKASIDLSKIIEESIDRTDLTHRKTVVMYRGSRNLVGIIFSILIQKYDFFRMETNRLNLLSRIVLSSEILNHFSLLRVEQTSAKIHIHLDEQKNPVLSDDMHFESKGFMEAASVTDFPVRDYKVLQKIRLRRWTDTHTSNSLNIPIDLDLVCKGTCYSKKF